MCLYFINHKNHLIVFTILIALLLTAASFDADAIPKYGSDKAPLSSVITVSNAAFEVISEESRPISVVREEVSARMSQTRTCSGRGMILCLILFILAAALSAFSFFEFDCRRSFLGSHHYTIAYIHDLDGMKA